MKYIPQTIVRLLSNPWQKKYMFVGLSGITIGAQKPQTRKQKKRKQQSINKYATEQKVGDQASGASGL